MAGDVMACGCFWVREPGRGDVLTQCAPHKAGVPYEGSEPPTGDEKRAFIKTLRNAGIRVVDLSEEGPTDE